jgi:prepilin-type N-terminal cleavage/methylation domain-containing protein
MKSLLANLHFLCCLLFKNSSMPKRAAFTLTELLVVITVISILLGLLYGAIRTVSRYSRETITRAELANIEAAFKQYYNYYHSWPTNAVETAPSGTTWSYEKDAAGDVQHEIGYNLSSMLAGITNNGVLNPDAVSFLEFTRFDLKQPPAPVSAWGSVRGQRYVVKLDANGDNQLTVPVDANNNTTNIFRRVAAWTVNPDRPGVLIGSWQQ